MTHDVVIVGGGPAGLATAIVLGERGFSVAVCEPRANADKVCGEGIMPSGAAALERLGVSSLIEQPAPLSGIRFCVPGGPSASAEFSEGPGLVVRRPELSRALAARAARIPSIELVRERARAFERGPDAIRVWAGGKPLAARLLIGADGLDSRVRRWAGLEHRTGRGAERWGARQHFDAGPWTDLVEVHFADGLEAYVSASGAEQVGVAILWQRRRARLSGGRDLVRRALAHFPALARRLGGARACTRQLATGPLERRTRGPCAEGVLLVGDAAGYLDAITGEGISLALCSALALGDPLEHALLDARARQGLVSARELRAAAALYERGLRRNRLVTRTLLSLAERPGALSRLITAFAGEPAVFRHFLSANMGLVSPFAPPLSSTLRLVLGLGRGPASAAHPPLDAG